MKINTRRVISYDPVKNESYEEMHFDLFVNLTREYESALELLETAVAGIKTLLAESIKTKLEPRHRFSCVKKLGKTDRPLPMPAPTPASAIYDPAVLKAATEKANAAIAKVGEDEEMARVALRKKEAEARKAAKEAAKEAREKAKAKAAEKKV